jgi:phasin family protein
MTTLTEQLSAVRKSQLEAQLAFMRAVTTQAFESANQMVSLNLNTSRASVERSASALKQLLTMSDPRDLFVLGNQAQDQVQQMLAYSRELFSIASGAGLNLQRQAAAQPAPEAAHAAPAQPAEAEAAPAPALAAPQLEEGTDPPAEPKPIAKAVRKAGEARPAVPHPVASEVAIAPKGVELPRVEAVDAAPPAVKASLEVRQAPLPGIKSARKSTRK